MEDHGKRQARPVLQLDRTGDKALGGGQGKLENSRARRKEGPKIHMKVFLLALDPARIAKLARKQ